MSRRVFLGRAGALAAGAMLAGPALGSTALASPTRPRPRVGDPVSAYGPEVARSWFRAIYQGVKDEGYVPAVAPGSYPPEYFPNGRALSAGFPHGFTPTSAARLYAYVGIVMYEALVAGMPDHRSMDTMLRSMPAMPKVHPRSGSVDWPLVLSSALHQAVPGFFILDASKQALADHHAAVVQARVVAGADAGIIQRSAAHAKAVVDRLQPWIEADGYQEIRALGETTPYVPPVGPGLWSSTSPNFGPAIEPFWDRIRPFALRSASEVVPEPPIPFSIAPGSAFREQAMEVFSVEQASLSNVERRTIARFWTDNPTQSGLPSGHWLLVIGQVAEQRGLGLDTVVEAHARTGVALADAFLSCWTEKYRSNVLRPVDFFHRYVQHDVPAPQRWRPITNTPQFPEYTSGHSVSSLAAATVLTDLLGSFPYVDDHDLADMAGLSRVRSFTSFLHAADEAATSRVYGGIHYPMGIEVGTTQGAEVGRLMVQRLRTRKGR
jgi:membrane-associated phospholipid phosphatase